MTATPTFAAITTKELLKLSEKRISRAGILVYCAVSSHLRGFEGKTSCFPSIDRLMALLGSGLSRASIFRALKELKDNGFIKTERTNERKSNTYHLRIREVIKKTIAFLQGQSDEKQRLEGNKKYRGLRNKSQPSENKTYKRTTKREIKSIDWDEIIGKWVLMGTAPSVEEIQKIPSNQLNWLKQHQPKLYEMSLAVLEV